MARDLPHNHLMHVPAAWSRYYLWLLVRIFIAEMLGSSIVILPAIIVDPTEKYEPLLAGIAMGGGLYVAIWVFYPVSGGHINPILSLAAYITKRVHLPHLALYWSAQMLGAFLATGTGLALSPFLQNTTHRGMSFPSPGVTQRQAFGVEILISGVLVVVFLTTIDEHRPSNWALGTGVNMAMAMMFTQLGNTIIADSITKGSMNPFRSLAPAFINNNFSQQWIYLLGPMIGAVIGVIVHELLITNKYITKPYPHKDDTSHVA